MKLGFQTNLVIDGCRGVELKPGDIEAAVKQMTDAGVTVVHSNEIEEQQ